MRVLTMRGYLALLAVGLVLLGGLFAVGAARAQTADEKGRVMSEASGLFEVKVIPADPEVVEAGLGLSRYALTKTWSGGLVGTSVGQMLAGGPNADTGTYVAIERFIGTLDGRTGAFLLVHRGDMTPEGYSLSMSVAPNSGTNALSGLEGRLDLTIGGGEHRYVLTYSLPD